MAVSLRQEGERRRRPHLLFVLYALAVAVGVFAAIVAPATRAGWSLGSKLVNRCEVGAAVGGLAYFLVIGGWLAWNGRFLGHLGVPGGLSGGGESQPIDAAAGSVDVAADDFNDYRKEVDARFKRIENAAGNIVNRLERLERSPRPQSEKRRRDRFVGKLRFLRRGNGQPDEEREQ